MNVGESLLHALRDHGAQQVFGIPGDFALPYFRIIEESQILPLYTLSHEPGVGFAADAAARINGSLGVAAVTYGAGALNMINSVAAAFAEKSPLVVLSGAPAAHEAATKEIGASAPFDHRSCPFLNPEGHFVWSRQVLRARCRGITAQDQDHGAVHRADC